MRPAPRRLSDLSALADLEVAAVGILRFYDPAKGFGYVAVDKGPDAYLAADVVAASGIETSRLVEGAAFSGRVVSTGAKGRVVEIAEIGPPKAGLTARPGTRTENVRARLSKYDAETGLGVFRVVGRDERIVVDAKAFEREGVEVDVNYDYDLVVEQRAAGMRVVRMSGPDRSVKRYASTEMVYDQYDPDKLELMAGMVHDPVATDHSIPPPSASGATMPDGGFSFGFRR